LDELFIEVPCAIQPASHRFKMMSKVASYVSSTLFVAVGDSVATNLMTGELPMARRNTRRSMLVRGLT
jgi:hypothetical protein